MRWTLAVAAGACAVSLLGCRDASGPVPTLAVTLVSVSGDTVGTGQTVQFIATVTGGGDGHRSATIHWLIGSDTIGSGRSITHAFGTAGPVTLYALAEADGTLPGTGSLSLVVVANAPPAIDSVSVPLRAWDGTTLDVRVWATDDHGPVRAVWTATGLGSVEGESAAIVLPARESGPLALLLRVTDRFDAEAETTLTVTTLPTARVLWRREVFSDALLDAMVALAPDGSVRAGAFSSRAGPAACSACLVSLATDGSLLWTFDTGYPPFHHSSGLTTGPDGTAYYFGFRGRGHAITAAGTATWTRDSMLAPDSHGRWVLDSAGRLVAGGHRNGPRRAAVVRVDPTTGDDVWVFERNGYESACSLSGFASSRVTMAMGGRLFVVDTTGSPTDSTATPSVYTASFTGAIGPNGRIYCRGMVSIIALSAASVIEWEVPTPPAGASSGSDLVVDANGGVYEMNADGAVLRHVSADGALVWETPLGPGEAFARPFAPSAALLADGSVIATNGPAVYRVDRVSGAILDSIPLGESIVSALAVGATGSIVVVTADGWVFALDGWAAPDPAAYWAQHRHDARRTSSVTNID